MKKNVIISPSLLACDFSKIGDELKRIEDAGAEYIHLDVMDGIFVPNISFGQPVIKSIRKISGLVFDVHLMITDPIRYIDSFADAGADIITVHLESADNIARVLEYIKSKGIKASLSIKPKTPVAELKPYLPLLDMILIMSVEPGFGGQSFIEESTEKIRQTKELTESLGYGNIDIEVDGGISGKNVRQVIEAGANVIVAGSSVFHSDNIKEAVAALRG